MEHYFGVAEKEGITRDEVETLQSIVMAVAAAKIRAQFREARVKGNKKN